MASHNIVSSRAKKEIIRKYMVVDNHYFNHEPEYICSLCKNLVLNSHVLTHFRFKHPLIYIAAIEIFQNIEKVRGE